MGRFCNSVVPRVSVDASMASTVDESVFLVAMSRFASNHTGTRTHLQRINVVQATLCQCAMRYDTIDHGLYECGLHWAAGMDHGRSIKDLAKIWPKNSISQDFCQISNLFWVKIKLLI
jgi:hypothetical protein